MLTLKKTLAAFGLGLLVGANAWAQETSNANQNKDRDEQKQQGQSQKQSQTIHGEVASISILGEAMVNHETGRAVMAEMTYMTILGSPSWSGQANDERDHAKSNPAEKNPDSANSRYEKRPGRRTVYQVAIGPETQIEDWSGNHGQGNSNNNKQDSNANSAGARSQAALEKLELGDQVEVVFEGIAANASGSKDRDNPAGSSASERHGRHKIVRGIAKKVVILSTPEQNQGGQHANESQDKDSQKNESQNNDKQKNESQKNK